MLEHPVIYIAGTTQLSGNHYMCRLLAHDIPGLHHLMLKPTTVPVNKGLVPEAS